MSIRQLFSGCAVIVGFMHASPAVVGQDCNLGFNHIAADLPKENGNAAFLSNKSPEPFGYQNAVAGSPEHVWQPEEEVQLVTVRALVSGSGPDGEGTLDFSQIDIWYVHIWFGWERFIEAPIWGDINWGFLEPTLSDFTFPVGLTDAGLPIFEISLMPIDLILQGGQEYVIGISAVASSTEVGSLYVLESSNKGLSDSQSSSLLPPPGWQILIDDPESTNWGVLSYQVVAVRTECEIDCGPTGDFDLDGDVDLLDFLEFQLCFTGEFEKVTPECVCADFDANGRVDLLDFGQFSLAYTGDLSEE
jgi:hypothetical protein